MNKPPFRVRNPLTNLYKHIERNHETLIANKLMAEEIERLAEIGAMFEAGALGGMPIKTVESVNDLQSISEKPTVADELNQDSDTMDTGEFGNLLVHEINV